MMMEYDKSRFTELQRDLLLGKGRMTGDEAVSFAAGIDSDRLRNGSQAERSAYLHGAMRALESLGYDPDWVGDFMEGLLIGRYMFR